MIGIMCEALIDRVIGIGGAQRALNKDSYLFHQSEPIHSVFVVLKGLVELVRYQMDGNSIVLQRARCNTILAEASVYSESYHCDAIARLPSRYIEVPKTRFQKQLRKDQDFADLWTAHLAREMQSARFRSEILARRTVAERLDGWFAWKGNTMPEKGNWKSIAEQIGVSPEALYRELAKRKH